MQKPTNHPESHVPEHSPVALLLIDVINDFQFPEAEQLLRYAVPMAERISELKSAAYEHNVPVIYVNDNFGRWQSDFRGQVEHCLREAGEGRHIIELLTPGERDYFVLKPRHSGFHSTTLETLLSHLDVQELILTGVAGNICVLFTANDAYMRGFKLWIPRDAVASNTAEDNDYAVAQMEKVLKANVVNASNIPWSRW
ncbi:cysteine hydrolase family protein [Aeoliella sp. SH292]|uniref:cysteine hydrolase family protein n=1 Tax=Aeoliella sp. SH292 TaxID=3454464 RepID=UPI003F99AFF7